MEYGDIYTDDICEEETYIHGEVATAVDYSYLDF